MPRSFRLRTPSASSDTKPGSFGSRFAQPCPLVGTDDIVSPRLVVQMSKAFHPRDRVDVSPKLAIFHLKYSRNEADKYNPEEKAGQEMFDHSYAHPRALFRTLRFRFFWFPLFGHDVDLFLCVLGNGGWRGLSEGFDGGAVAYGFWWVFLRFVCCSQGRIERDEAARQLRIVRRGICNQTLVSSTWTRIAPRVKISSERKSFLSVYTTQKLCTMYRYSRIRL